ncbi:MAG TPA: ATP-binding protein [Nostocaceae cyanobacterium]|nr:ATP-binding protein [Nostocaceae cyanobacterium]
MTITSKNELILPLTYEETVDRVGSDIAKMAEFIVPVTEFEEQIIQVVNDMRRNGYLLFLYGISGIGKSTFVSSLKWRSHIPIKKILPINASEFNSTNEPWIKLKRLYSRLSEIANKEKQEITLQDNSRTCIVIDYLESLQDEDLNNVRAFFRDLNGLLRQAPILVIWPVTEREDLESMQKAASSFSSTMFHRRIPVIEFTGPPIKDYPKIAKNTISFFNQGRTYYEFQLHDEDFDEAVKEFMNKQKGNQIIRNYLQKIIEIWETRTDHITKMMRTVPKPTEVWFIVCYPEAEDVINAFTKRSPDIEEAWNADFNQLAVYTRNNQREADWKPQRLSLALSGVLNTKILYLPTNTFVSCIAAHFEEAEIPFSREELEKMGIPPHWFQKSQARQTLMSSPVYLQLANKPQKKGKRGSGKNPEALETARPIFESFNKIISEASDHPFNRALCMALQNALEDNEGLEFNVEKPHPWLSKIRPDILINVKNTKCICLEMHYTVKTAPNIIAKYVLEKLNKYMKQIESMYESGQIPLL